MRQSSGSHRTLPFPPGQVMSWANMFCYPVTTLQEGGVHIARAQEAGVVAGARPGGDEERAEWARLPRVNSLGQIMKEIYEARDTHMGMSSQHGNAAPSSRGGSWYPEG